MRRLVLSAAVVTGLLLPTSAVAGDVADGPRGSAPERTVTGEVVTFVEEGRPEPHQALVTDQETIPVAGTVLEPETRVTATLADVPGPVDEVVDVFEEERVRTAPSRLRSTSQRHRVYVAFVAPKGTSTRDRMPSARQVTRMVNRRVSGYWSSQTGGQVTFRVAAVRRPYASAHGCGDPWAMWDEARDGFGSAATGPAAHVLLVLPETARRRGCAVGMGSLGRSAEDGGVLYVALHSSAIYAHELGHNLGLDHADSLLCDRRQDTAFTAQGTFGNGGCHHHAYDDWLEVMSSSGGARGTGSLNGAHIDDLGLLPGSIRTVAPGSQVTLRLAPLSSGPGKVRVAKVVESSSATYFVQYRTNSGIDAGKVPSSYRLGVEIHREDPTSYGRSGSLFLDATPTGRYDLNRSLPVGRRFVSTTGKVTVEVLRQGSRGATVLVRNGGSGS